VTSYDLGVDGTKVKITWTAPYTNSETILDYQILILEKDQLTYFEETLNCNGQVDPVKSQLYCFVPLTVLRASPYLLEFNDLVFAKARARNIWGYGAFSEKNVIGVAI
jgi:hypothetical protein